MAPDRTPNEIAALVAVGAILRRGLARVEKAKPKPQRQNGAAK